MGSERDKIQILREKMLDDEAITPIGKKHKKKHRRPEEDHRHCPFCKKELPIDKNSKEYKQALKRRPWVLAFGWGIPRLDCPCGAIKVKLCPACQRETFYKDGIFKHQKGWLNCGFVGNRRSVYS